MTEEPSLIEIDEYVIDMSRGRLLDADGEQIPLRPKAFDLLVALAKAEGRPLSKAALLDAVWGKVHVTEDSLFQAVKDARRAIGDDKASRLRSVPRHGYALETHIKFRSSSESSPKPVQASDAARTASLPSIAVLPFRKFGPSQDRDYIADGMAEEITAALTRFSWLVVIATNSAATAAKAQRNDPTEIGRLLNVRYLLDGSVTFDSGSLIIRCHLVETGTGRYVWQHRVESEGTNLIALYEAITSAIAAALEPRILHAEIERALQKGTSDLSAFDCYLRALPGYYSRTPQGNAEAITFLQASLGYDPRFHLARALLSRCIATTLWLGVENDTIGDAARALSLAREALAGDRADPLILALSGHLLALFGNEHDEASALLEQSLRLNPNSAETWRLAAWVATFGGETDLAIQRLEQCECLDPISPLRSDAYSCRAAALTFGHRFEEAIAAARRSLVIAPKATTPRRFLIVSLHHIGAFDEAKQEMVHLMSMQPNGSLWRSRVLYRYRHGWMTEMMLEGLGQSGMPESPQSG